MLKILSKVMLKLKEKNCVTVKSSHIIGSNPFTLEKVRFLRKTRPEKFIKH